MADLPTQVHHHHQHDTNTPLLNSHQSHANQQQQEEDVEDTELEHTLQKLDTFLSFLGFRQSSKRTFLLSWFGFLLVGVFVPVFVLEELLSDDCSGCKKYQIKSFELEIMISQICLAAVSLGCLARNLRKYGIRKFLFVDRYSGQMPSLHDQYIQQIKGSMRLLLFWMLPCFILKSAREILRLFYMRHESWWMSIAILLALVISWTYLSVISLSASVLFHLVCNLQILHYDDYASLLESESDVLVLMEEHARLRYHLSKISHRFRIYLVLGFLIVTGSQFVTLFQTTGYSGMVTFINGGDFVVSSLVQVAGVTICLHAGTRMSHRAKGIVSLASRWHALITCSSNEATHSRHSNSSGNLNAANQLNSINLDYSESDLESLEFAWMPTNMQLPSYVSSYHKRHSFVTYLQNNPGGITLYGCAVDRGLMDTIFFLELTLILFVLGKTLVFSAKPSGTLGDVVLA